jgi:hypothetical protein
MRTGLVLAVALVVATTAFVYFVPVVHVAAAPPGGCNFTCASGGHGQYYVSTSYSVFGQGAMYWPSNPGLGTYELIGTPLGSFG